MNVLFLTLVECNSIEESNIYTDLLREFIKDKHHVYIISPVEKKNHIRTHIIQENNSTILRLKTGNLFKTNIIEKGISTLTIEKIYKRGIKKYFKGIKFDLILYSTPPITLQKAINYVKKRDSSITYLLLKDIFPQNAVDIGILQKKGAKGIIYHFFRKKEKRLYRDSDFIGCMSQANVKYLLEHNRNIDVNKVNIVPNCVEVKESDYLSESDKKELLCKYNIPKDKFICLYGGNLGKPQGIDFMIECFKKSKCIESAYFLIVGDGTEYEKINCAISDHKLNNVGLHKWIPKNEYKKLVQCCDAGLIFLDYRFTIPNFPSRLLTYLEAGLPVIAATDKNTDVGEIIEKNGFGYKCYSNEADSFVEKVKKIIATDSKLIGKKGRDFLEDNYSSKVVYKFLCDKLKKEG
jgi:glycosyltransferase involved in cell wall biosynthesis